MSSKPPPIEPESVATAKSTAGPPSSARFGWLHFLAPSVTDGLFVTILAGLSCGALGRILLRDPSIGWHIRNGQQMILTHAITRNDPFSATINGGPWFAWEWLYDVVIAVIHQTLGLNGVVFFTAAIIAAAFVLTLNFAVRRGANLLIVCFLLLLSLAASSIHFLARPHVLSWLLIVIWFELLDSAATSSDSRTNAGLFALPVLMIFWVNLHGGFVLGFALLGIYLLDAAIRFLAARERREQARSWLWRLGLVTLLTFLASFVNPYGYHLHVHVYQYLSDRFLMNHISEFLSPDFHLVAQQCFAVLLLLTILAMARAHRGLTAARLLVVVFAVYSGLYASRSLPTSSLLITLIIAPMLSQSVAEAGENSGIQPRLRACFARLHSFGSRMGKLELDFSDHFWLVVIFLLGLWACIHGGRLGSGQFVNAYFDSNRVPVDAAAAIESRGIREPIFSLDFWGGYLIYRLYPQTKVLVDDRHDLYGEQFFRDYLKVLFIQPGWEKLLEQENVNWVLMPQDSTLASMLRLLPAWKVVYEDRGSVLFQRVGT